jgi:hypothetical protein
MYRLYYKDQRHVTDIIFKPSCREGVNVSPCRSEVHPTIDVEIMGKAHNRERCRLHALTQNPLTVKRPAVNLETIFSKNINYHKLNYNSYDEKFNECIYAAHMKAVWIENLLG